MSEVGFRIDEHELVGLIGPNGGGKTTLLQVILGVRKPERGTIRVFGRDPRKLDDRRNDLGYVAQSKRFELDFPARAKDVVLMGTFGQVGLFRMPGPEHRRRALEALIMSGALEGLAGHRRQMLDALPDALAYGARIAEDRRKGQSSLFGDATDVAGVAAPALPDGTPSVSVTPSEFVCFGDLPPCKDKPEEVAREVVLVSRGAKAGNYTLSLDYCFTVEFALRESDQFKLDLVAS